MAKYKPVSKVRTTAASQRTAGDKRRLRKANRHYASRINKMSDTARLKLGRAGKIKARKRYFVAEDFSIGRARGRLKGRGGTYSSGAVTQMKRRGTFGRTRRPSGSSGTSGGTRPSRPRPTGVAGFKGSGNRAFKRSAASGRGGARAKLAAGALHKAASQRSAAEKRAVRGTRVGRGRMKAAAQRTTAERTAVRRARPKIYKAPKRTQRRATRFTGSGPRRKIY